MNVCYSQSSSLTETSYSVILPALKEISIVHNLILFELPQINEVNYMCLHLSMKAHVAIHIFVKIKQLSLQLQKTSSLTVRRSQKQSVNVQNHHGTNMDL